MINRVFISLVFCLCYCNNILAITVTSPLVTKTEKYLNSLNNISAQFIQRSNNNAQTGNFILSNKQDVRWEYKKPRNIVITFCNKKIAYHDKDLNNKEVYSIDNPFVNFIAQRPINLQSNNDFFIKEINDKKSQFELTISNIKKSVGSFILVFNKQPIQLDKLVLFDDFGTPIEVSFYNLINYKKPPSSPLFHCEVKGE